MTPSTALDFEVGNTFYVGLAAANGAGVDGRTFINFANDPGTLIVRTQACC